MRRARRAGKRPPTTRFRLLARCAKNARLGKNVRPPRFRGATPSSSSASWPWPRYWLWRDLRRSPCFRGINSRNPKPAQRRQKARGTPKRLQTAESNPRREARARAKRPAGRPQARPLQRGPARPRCLNTILVRCPRSGPLRTRRSFRQSFRRLFRRWRGPIPWRCRNRPVRVHRKFQRSKCPPCRKPPVTAMVTIMRRTRPFYFPGSDADASVW